MGEVKCKVLKRLLKEVTWRERERERERERDYNILDILDKECYFYI